MTSTIPGGIDLQALLVEYSEKMEVIHAQAAPFEGMVRILRHEQPELTRSQVHFLCINLWWELKEEPISKTALLQLNDALDHHFPTRQ